MQRIIVSAPFGNYLRFAGTTCTVGTYTMQPRGGVLRRLARVVGTVRYNRRSQAWINRLGLPNPGIHSVQGPLPGAILSIHGFDAMEWSDLAMLAVKLEPEAVELNLSCPNVGEQAAMLENAVSAIGYLLAWQVPAIAKLPPVRWMDMGEPLYDAGVRHFHLCNTLPTPGGGLSGKPLMQYSLWAIDDFRRTFGRAVTLIGGGGATCVDDVRAYRAAGADHVAVGSMLMNPFGWRRVRAMVASW